MKIQSKALNFDLARLLAEKKYGCPHSLQSVNVLVMKFRDSRKTEDIIGSFINMECVQFVCALKPRIKMYEQRHHPKYIQTEKPRESSFISVHFYAKKSAILQTKLWKFRKIRASLANDQTM